MTLSQSIVAINTHLLWLPECEKALRTAQLLVAARDALQRQREALQLLEARLRDGYDIIELEGVMMLYDELGDEVEGDTLEQLIEALYDLEHPKAGEP